MMTEAQRIKTVQEMEQDLAVLCQAIYEYGTRRFIPMYPWVLVRMLPKENKFGSLWTPEKQEKTLYEGIVIEPYPTKHTMSPKGKPLSLFCPVERGQRIVFPHHEGMPLKDWDDKMYRIVRIEADQDVYPKMGVFGTLTYDGDQELQERLKQVFADARMVSISGMQ